MVGPNPHLHEIVNNALIPPISDEVCGCGKPVQYFVADGKMACNKYFRCPTREQLVQEIIRLRKEIERLEQSQARTDFLGF